MCRRIMLLAVLIFYAGISMAAKKPNVLIIFADDLGYGDLGCYGATKLKTPNIDRIAKNGMRFTNAYTTSSTCSQSRVSLLTGRYWWRSPLHPPRGVIAPAGPNALLEQGIEPLPKLFQENGYRTAAFGKWHLGVGYGESWRERYDWSRPKIEGGPLDSGFDYFFGLAANVANEPAFYIENDTFAGRRPGDKVTVEGPKKVTPWSPDVLYKEDEVGGDTVRKAVEYIESAETDKPLFVYFASTVPHKPITPAKEFVGSSQCGIYGDFVQELDWQVGELIEALRDTGRLENTLIVFTSDNGAVVAQSEDFAKKWHLEPMWKTYAAGHRSNGELREGKHAVYEGGSRIPFIVSWPKHIPTEKQDERLFCLTDVFATFADLLERPVSENAVDSVSFLPVWTGKSGASPRENVSARTSNAIFSIRQGKWKMIEHDPGNPTKRKDENSDQLYDLDNDPGEQRNVFAQYPEVVERLKRELAKVKADPNYSVHTPLQAGEGAEPMQIAICPRLVPELTAKREDEFVRRVEELFFNKTGQWRYVSENISHFKFYSTSIVWMANKKPELLARVVKRIAAMEKGIAVEVGIRHGHGHTEKYILDPITKAGGRVDFIITDNVFIKSQFRKDKKGDYNWSYDQTIEKYAEYVSGIKKKYPKLKVGMIEAGFRFHWEDKTRFPAEEPKKDAGDLKKLLIDVIQACKAKGTRIDIFQPEYAYERIENTKNGWEKMKAMEKFCREQEIEFYFLFNDHIGGHDSDKLFHENVTMCLRAVKSHGLTPELGTIQSWYKHPVNDLPEDKPYTFMYLAKEFIRENRKTGEK